MTEVFKKQILRFLSRRNYSPQKLSALAKSIGVSDHHYPEFKAAFKELQKKGHVSIAAKNLITLPPVPPRVLGTFRANPKGFGFVIPNQPNIGGDMFIPPGDTAGAMTGDIVSIKTFKKGVRNGQMRYEGTIVEILEHGTKKIVGSLKNKGSEWFVQPDGREFLKAVTVDDVTAKSAKVDDKIVVEIITYPTDGSRPGGVIVEVLGKAGFYDAEIKSIIHQYSLPGDFSSDCLDQARRSAEMFDPDSENERDDISDQVVITIDPPDAKDFDDAITLRKDTDGNWVLGVHIADVSSFVTMESPLDAEAYQRGNSVYLPGKVIPMLPEILSNGICSLQPGQKRFAKSAYITYDLKGNVLSREFANSIICSTARLTYKQADDILQGKAAEFPGQVVALVKDTEILARAIEKRRFKNGMLHLDLPETELILDRSGQVVDAEPADDCYPHTIIEMFMVEANEAVAALLDRFGVPFMRRIHPEPEPVGMKNLGKFVKLSGLKVPRSLDRAAIQDLLAAVKGTSKSYAVNTYILRSLQRAEYAPLHIGHFALASTHYCHFTSPIRRYADLLVHRLLQCYIEERLNQIGLEEALPEGQLSEMGEHITFTEQQATDAERELKTVLILQMLSSRVGSEMDCVVSGLTNFGVFVQCTKFGIEGLIEFGDLGFDEWKYNERQQAVVGLHSGKSAHLGQDMHVRIVEVNVPARRLTLAPVKMLVDSRQKFDSPKSRKKAKKRKKQRKKQRTR